VGHLMPTNFMWSYKCKTSMKKLSRENASLLSPSKMKHVFNIDFLLSVADAAVKQAAVFVTEKLLKLS
jgi:hypothetical protein